jgi:dolichol-phosphate mannosyltransferase
MKVSIIIPTKNEPHVQELVDKIHRVISNLDHEIIVVDKSDVAPKLKGAKVIRQKSNGLGKAFLEGLKLVKGEIVVLMDGDGSHRPEDLPKLIEKTKNYDIVIGSRYVKGGKTKDKFYRILVSRFYCFLTSLVLGLKIKDNMSGFAAVRAEVYEKIKLNPIGFKINTELLYKAKKLDLKITEVPIIFEKRRFGKSKGTLKEGLKTLNFILKLRLANCF